MDKQVTGYGNKPHLFRVTTELRTRFLLQAVSGSEALGWIEEIEAASHVDDEEQNDEENDDDNGEGSGEDENGEDGDSAEDDETEDEEEKADRVPEKAQALVASSSSSSKAPKPFFRKMSQADTEKSSVRLKRRNIINHEGEEVEIIGI